MFYKGPITAHFLRSQLDGGPCVVEGNMKLWAADIDLFWREAAGLF
jgi:hypothetical protein